MEVKHIASFTSKRKLTNLNAESMTFVDCFFVVIIPQILEVLSKNRQNKIFFHVLNTVGI